MSSSVYGELLVNFMLKSERAFTPFRSCYYLLYQCLVPNPREGLSLLVQHCSVPDDFERVILSGRIPRLCNQGILNYLLIILRRDKDFAKFWNVVKLLIDQPELRKAVERIQKNIFGPPTVTLFTPLTPPVHPAIGDDFAFEGAPLMVGYKDDCCIHYTVTIVDVRSCTRCTRVPVSQVSSNRTQDFTELQCHYSVLVRSMPDDYMNTVNQLERHLTGDHIGSILECVNVFTANQRILDCLIEQLNDKEDVLDLCSWLSHINDAPLLTNAIQDLKKDIIISLKSDGSTASERGSCNLETSLSPNDLSNFTAAGDSPEKSGDIFTRVQLHQYRPNAIAMLKKHYNALWWSFPNDYMKTLTQLCGLTDVDETVIDMVISQPTSDHSNRTMLDIIIYVLKGEQHLMEFCNLMEKFINNTRLSKIVDQLRNDCRIVVLQSMLLQYSRPSNDGTTQVPPLTANESIGNVNTFGEDESSTTGDSSQQDGGDVGPSFIERLPEGVSQQCRTMLHKYYDMLWQSFPQDHLITLSRLCDLLPVDEGLVETIVSYSSSDMANKRILNAALSNLKSDTELLGFSMFIEQLTESSGNSKIIEKFKSDCMRVIERKSMNLTDDDDDTSTHGRNDGPHSSQDSITEGGPPAASRDEPAEEFTPLVLQFLPSTITANTIAVLRKYYTILWQSFSDDHVANIKLLNRHLTVTEGFYTDVVSTTDPDAANKMILNALIHWLKQDDKIMEFCKVMRILATNRKYAKEVLQFEIECIELTEKLQTESSSSADSEIHSRNTTRPSAISNFHEIDRSFLQQLSSDISPECYALLKKYGNFLLNKFPPDHLETLAKVSKQYPLDDILVDSIVTASCPAEGNQRILKICMLMVQTDKCLNEFCSTMEKLVDNPKLSKIMEVFRHECEAVVNLLLSRNQTTTNTQPTVSVASLTTLPSSAAVSGGSISTVPRSLSTSAASMSTSITSLSTSAGSMSTSITSLSTSAGSMSTSITSLSTSAGSMSTSITSLSTSAGSMSTSITSLSTSAGLMSTSVASISTSAELISTSVTPMSNSVASMSTSTKSTLTSIASLSISAGTTSTAVAAIPNSDTPVPTSFATSTRSTSIASISTSAESMSTSVANLVASMSTSAESTSTSVGSMLISTRSTSVASLSISAGSTSTAIAPMPNSDRPVPSTFASMSTSGVSMSTSAGSISTSTTEIQSMPVTSLASSVTSSPPTITTSTNANTVGGTFNLADGNTPPVLFFLPRSVSDKALAVLKKYYDVLLESFTNDHATTICTLCEIIQVDEGFFNEVLSMTDTKEANRRILNAVICILKSDNQLVGLCEVVKALISIRKRFSKEIIEFEIECRNLLKNVPPAEKETSSTETTTQITASSSPAVATESVSDNNDTTQSSRAGDAEPKVFANLLRGLSPNGVAVLKKHYYNLLRSFPPDHMTNLGKMCKHTIITDELVDQVLDCPTPEESNQAMLDIMILIIKEDNDLLEFCKALEGILGNKLTVLGPFRIDCMKVLASKVSATQAPSLSTNTTTAAATATTTTVPTPSSSSIATSSVPTITSSSVGNMPDPVVFSHLPPGQLSAKGQALLKKYYHALLKAFPEEYFDTLSRVHDLLTIYDEILDRIIACPTAEESNKAILNLAIIFKGSDDDLLEFCSVMEAVIKDKQKVAEVVEPLRNECLKLMMERNPAPMWPLLPTASSMTTTSISTTPSITAITEDTPVPIERKSSQESSVVMTAEDSKAALRTFDEHSHLMTLLDPSGIEEELHTAGLLPTDHPTSLTTGLVMEKLLKHIRSCVELKGAEMFISFINVLHSDGRYGVLSDHLFGMYISHGGHSSQPCSATVSPAVTESSVTQLLGQLTWYLKQLQAGLHYQSALPLPDNYIQCDQLLENAVDKLTDNSNTPSVGTVLNICGVGGMGKSTLAKALCHDVRLKMYFLDGFLWIRLGPLPVSPAVKLGQLYHLLTNKTEVGNQSFFVSKLQHLITNHLHKLLVIIDDVWEVADALVYTEVFRGCKMVLTTRKENVSKLIPSQLCLTVKQMKEEVAVKLLTTKLEYGASLISEAAELVNNLHCWPLLLNLVHNQIIDLVTEQGKPVDQVITCIQKTLRDNGLHAIDIDRKRSAIVSTVKSSIGLLSTDEIHVLQKLVLSVGLSMPIPITLLPDTLKHNRNEVDKLCGRLLSLGLLSHCHTVSPSNHKTVQCYEVHYILSQYILDHMKFDSPVELVDAVDLGELHIISNVLAGGRDSNVSHRCLATITAIDTVILPNHIRSLFAITKCLQHEVQDCLNQLSVICIRAGKLDLVGLALNFKKHDTLKEIERLHQLIREDCRKLQMLLVDDKHEEATEWLKKQAKSHPLRKAISSFGSFVKDLLNRCQDNETLITSVKTEADPILQCYKSMLKKCCEHSIISLRRDLVAMVTAGSVTLDQYQRLLDDYDKELAVIKSGQTSQ